MLFLRDQFIKKINWKMKNYIYKKLNNQNQKWTLLLLYKNFGDQKNICKDQFGIKDYKHRKRKLKKKSINFF